MGSNTQTDTQDTTSSTGSIDASTGSNGGSSSSNDASSNTGASTTHSDDESSDDSGVDSSDIGDTHTDSASSGHDSSQSDSTQVDTEDSSSTSDESDSTSGSTGSTDDLDPLDACEEAEVDRLRVWDIQSVGGTSTPDNWQDPIIDAGMEHAIEVEFSLPPSDGSDGANYGTVNVPLANGREDDDGTTIELSVDLGDAEFIRLGDSSTAVAFLQVRYGADAHGGHHFRVPLPSTDGELQVVDFPFEDFRRPQWATTYPDERVKIDDVFSLTFTTFQSVIWRIESLRIPGYTPPCAK